MSPKTNQPISSIFIKKKTQKENKRKNKRKLKERKAERYSEEYHQSFAYYFTNKHDSAATSFSFPR